MSRQYLSRQNSGYRGVNALLAVLLPTLASAAPVNAVASSLTTSLTGANNDMVFTAKTKGVVGDGISVAYVNPGTPSAALSVTVSGKDITVNLATGAGTAQVETATVTAAGGATDNGNLTVTVTSALLASPAAVLVPLTTATHTTAALIATAIAAALTADATVSTYFTAVADSATVVLTRKAAYARANDTSENLAIAAGLGVSAAASSANTTAGVAPAITSTAAQIKTAIEASAAAAALVSVANYSTDTGAGAVTALTKTSLASGVDGTPGEAFEQRVYSGYLYVNVSDDAKGTATDTWYKTQLTLVS